MKTLDTASTTAFEMCRFAGGKIFYLKAAPGADNVKLYVQDRSGAQERLLLDPELLTKDGVHYSIDYYRPSLDGTLVAYGISPGGSEKSVIHILETATGKQLPDSIDRARFGAIQWLPGSKSFFYNRLQKMTPDMPKTAFEQRSRAYLHQLGQDPDRDRFVFGFGYSSDVKIDDNDLSFINLLAGVALSLRADGTWNAKGGYRSTTHPSSRLKSSPIKWKKLFDVDADVVSFDVHKDDIYLVTHKRKPRYEVTRTSLKNPDIEHASSDRPRQ